jgi:hypothetical protein
MTDTSVDSDSPPAQDDSDGLLGEFQPATYVRLTLQRWGDEVILWRHRNPRNSGPNADPAARITRVDGVTITDWDDWHRKHRPVWMPSVEDWVREALREAS